MGKFKTQAMRDRKKLDKMGPSPARLTAPSAPPAAPHATGRVAYSRRVPEREIDFGELALEDRPADWEDQLRAAGLDEDWIDAYRPPPPEDPAPPEGMEQRPPWKCYQCNRYRLEWWTGDEGREDLEDAASDFDTSVEEDEISPYILGRTGEKIRSAICNWCDTPVHVVVTGQYRGAQE